MPDFDIFPTLDEPEAKTTAVAITAAAGAAPRGIKALKTAVLDEFAQTEPVLRTLVSRYDNVAIDVATPKGMKAAREARHDMREHGRYVIQRATDELKGEVNALKPLIEAESERLIAIVKPTEDRYDEAIKAQESVDKAAKAEREAKEAERVAAHRANIAKLASYIGAAQGKTSTQILTVINGVSGIEIIPEQWEEFAASAETQKADTLEALQALFDRTKTAEDEAAAREAQRVENARVAAELAEAQRVMAAKQAELDAKLAAIAAAEKEKAEQEAAAAKAQEDAARAIAEAAARQVAEDEANAKAQEAAAQALQAAVDATPAEVIADAYTPSTPAAADMAEVTAQAWALPTSPITFAEPPAPAADEPATLNLTAINDRFGGALSVTAAGLAILGIQPAAQVKAARLYRESQFIELCDALVDHIGNACTAAA